MLPESVKYIGDHAFTGTQIKELTLSNLKYLGTSAFKDCESLQSINIPENIDTIRSRTFEGCISLTELKLPLWFRGDRKQCVQRNGSKRVCAT